MLLSRRLGIALLAATLSLCGTLPVFAAGPSARIKDLARFGGVRQNQLVGYGLVVGLDGTGDKNAMTAQSLANMLKNFEVTVDPRALKAQNSAAVVVTATVEPFSRAGDKLDVMVSSVGDAKSIQGGVLIQTPLRAGNGRIYAVAQGPISIGGAQAQGGGGAGGARNHPTVARIPSGALMEREVPATFGAENGKIDIVLNAKDFTTANAIRAALSERLGEEFVTAVDAGLVRVVVPASFEQDPVAFISLIESTRVVADRPTKVVINEKTGTVVLGEEVRIAPVVISHGTLKLRVAAETQGRARPEGGTDRNLIYLESNTSVRDVMDSLNAVGTTAKDVIAVFQAIRAAGALNADLEVI